MPYRLNHLRARSSVSLAECAELSYTCAFAGSCSCDCQRAPSRPRALLGSSDGVICVPVACCVFFFRTNFQLQQRDCQILFEPSCTELCSRDPPVLAWLLPKVGKQATLTSCLGRTVALPSRTILAARCIRKAQSIQWGHLL